jgi:hypothetical protein
MTKGLLNSKTFWLNATSFVVLALALPEFNTIVPLSWTPYIALVTAVCNLFLRVYTDKAIKGW